MNSVNVAFVFAKPLRAISVLYCCVVFPLGIFVSLCMCGLRIHVLVMALFCEIVFNCGSYEKLTRWECVALVFRGGAIGEGS